MANVDMEMLRRKHEELNSGSSPTNTTEFLNNFLQLKEGTNAIRILPGKDDDTLFYAETKIHRVPTDEGHTKNVHCRKIHGEPCPLCDAYYQLWKDPFKDETLARQIKPRARYYLNVVDRDTEKVKILSVGVILIKKIIAAMLDEDFGDITDLQTGHDFKIVKIMEGQWPKYDQSQPRPKTSEAGSNAEIAAWMDSLHDIHALVKMEDYEEVKNMAQALFPSLEGDDLPSGSSTEVSDEGEFLRKLRG
jgi:hypothetical protein